MSMREICDLHGPLLDTINRIEEKVDDVISGRERIALQVATVQKTIDNGLRGDIKQALDAILKVQGILDSFNRRVVVLEDFSWFREWMTDLRTNLFKNVFKLIALTILGLAMFHASDTIVKNIIAGIVK